MKKVNKMLIKARSKVEKHKDKYKDMTDEELDQEIEKMYKVLGISKEMDIRKLIEELRKEVEYA